ncbi:ABC transporter substrate-binding protein [Roseiarcaceae bacterium H3SJ34-1]|uniref:ABC transporter substrate-binding protein n=1 Tax=Terripilifer ovatus TaxID=3032367 RepID=UPI003AB960C7|nr:ABC transporter substrate-binding protein [Roseiarcaceae bacterium H3SJ34-1]
MAIAQKFTTLCGALLLAAVSHTSCFALDKVTLQLNWLADGQKSAAFVGRDRGVFQRQGIDLEIKRGFGSGDTLTKLITGAADFGYVDLPTIMTADEGRFGKTKAIMSLFSKSPHALITTTDSGINSLNDLKGKTIASAPFSSTLLYLPSILRRSGIDISSVNIAKVEAATMGPLLVQGKVDGSMLWSPDASFVMPMLEKAGKKGKIIFLLDGGGNFNMYSLAVAATVKTISERPDLVRRFVAALLESHEIVRKEPEASTAALVKAEPQLDVATMIQMTKLTNDLMFNAESDKDGFGNFSPALVKETYDWMIQAGQVKTPQDPEMFVDRSFLPKK